MLQPLLSHFFFNFFLGIEEKCKIREIKMPWKCINLVNYFCYICGKITLSPQTPDAYWNVCPSTSFWMNVGDQDKPWAPHICRDSYSVILQKWLKNKKLLVAFVVSMIWRDWSRKWRQCGRRKTQHAFHIP